MSGGEGGSFHPKLMKVGNSGVFNTFMCTFCCMTLIIGEISAEKRKEFSQCKLSKLVKEKNIWLRELINTVFCLKLYTNVNVVILLLRHPCMHEESYFTP